MTPSRLPVLFIGHGSPMNAIEDNEFSRSWSEAGRSLPRPKAILCVSAHWETRGVEVTQDQSWGLDHGAWSVLSRLFPHADVPVIQLSLDQGISPQAHYDLGRQLGTLREEDILIIGSGNVVHNLGRVAWEDTAFEWAAEFDDRVKHWILDGNHEALIGYQTQGPSAALAINSAEHYKPLLYVLGAIRPGESVHFFAERVTLGSISMRSFRVD